MTYSNIYNYPTYNSLSEPPIQNKRRHIYDIQISDYWLEKGDYINFEYASLGYTLTKDVLKSNWCSDIRIGLSCNNVCTITGYNGLTPMINSASLVRQNEGTGNAGTLGVDDKRIYPLVRTFSLSLSINF